MAQAQLVNKQSPGYAQSIHPDRYNHVHRPYTPDEVLEYRNSVMNQLVIPTAGAEKMWERSTHGPVMVAIGAITGNQSVEYTKNGILTYNGGWQDAFDNNLQRETFPDRGFLTWDSPAAAAQRIVNANMTAERIHHRRGDYSIDWHLPIVTDIEAGWGSNAMAYNVTRAAVMAGSAAVHIEDQLSDVRRCGHLANKTVLPELQHYNKLVAVRFAMDVLGVPGVVINRTDAKSAAYISNDIDPEDHRYIDFDKGKTPDHGLYHFNGGIEAVIQRGIRMAPVAEVFWFETNKLDIGEAREVIQGVREKAPWVIGAYNWSPSVNQQGLDPKAVAEFRDEAAAEGFMYQFITVGGSHAVQHASHLLSLAVARESYPAYVEHQRREFASAPDGYDFTEHQERAGNGEYDRLEEIVTRAKVASSMVGKGGTSEGFGKG